MEKGLVLKDDSINVFDGSDKHICYNGVLDQVRIYYRTLTHDEIFYLYPGRKRNLWDRIISFMKKYFWQ